MFGFGSARGPARGKAKLDDILARHQASLAAERKAPPRNDQPPPILKKKAAFGKRSASLSGG